MGCDAFPNGSRCPAEAGVVPPRRHRYAPRTCKPRRCGDGPWSGAREDISQPQAPQDGDGPSNCAGLTHPEGQTGPGPTGDEPSTFVVKREPRENRPRTPGDDPRAVMKYRWRYWLRTPGPAPASHPLRPGCSQDAHQDEPQGDRRGHHERGDQPLRLHPEIVIFKTGTTNRNRTTTPNTPPKKRPTRRAQKRRFKMTTPRQIDRRISGGQGDRQAR